MPQRLPYRAATHRDWGKTHTDIRHNSYAAEQEPEQDRPRRRRSHFSSPTESRAAKLKLEQPRSGGSLGSDGASAVYSGGEHVVGAQGWSPTRPQLASGLAQPTESRAAKLKLEQKAADKLRLVPHGTSPPPSAQSAQSAQRRRRRSQAQERPPDASAIRDLKNRLLANSYQPATGAKVADLFKRYDRDRSGGLDLEEFTGVVRKNGQIPASKLSDAQIHGLFSSLGGSEQPSGQVRLERFVAFVEDKQPRTSAAGEASAAEYKETGSSMRQPAAAKKTRPSKRPGSAPVRSAKYQPEPEPEPEQIYSDSDTDTDQPEETEDDSLYEEVRFLLINLDFL